MLRVVVDTNIWIRILLGGQLSLPVLVALRENKFKVIFSDALLEELREVSQRPRLKKRIDPFDASELLELDEELRLAMAGYGVQLWGIQSLLGAFENG